MKRLDQLPPGVPAPPIGRYGKGRLDLLAVHEGRIWACLIDNSAFCTQEFYYWNGLKWVDKSIPVCEGGDKSRVRVPYKGLMSLYDKGG